MKEILSKRMKKLFDVISLIVVHLICIDGMIHINSDKFAIQNILTMSTL